MVEILNLLVVRHFVLELGFVHLRCGCHQNGVVLEPLAHLGHLEEEVVELHLLHRITHHDILLVKLLLWNHPWKRLHLELMV